MVRPHVALAALLAAVVATGIGVAQARATDPAKPSPPRAAAVVPTTPPTPLPNTVVRRSAPPRPIVRFPDSLAAGWGIDVSWPQCGAAVPAVQTGFAVVGVNGGRPLTGNPCLHDQLRALRGHLPVAFYLNLAAPPSGDPQAYGAEVVDDGLARIAGTGAQAPVVWLDVEVLNQWRDPVTNVAVINGALRRLAARGFVGGVYSSVPMWQQITGGAQLGVPVWLAITGSEVPSLRHACTVGLGGRTATMVQYVAITPAQQLVDADVLCRTDAGVLRLFGRL